MGINNKYESPKPKYLSWPWSRQLLRFKEVESFIIYMFDYLQLRHKPVCILSLSGNIKGVNIYVCKRNLESSCLGLKAEIALHLYEGICSIQAFLYVFYFDLSTSYREAKNLTDLMFFEVTFN